MSDPRKLALALLEKQEAAGQYASIALDSAIKQNALSPADRALLSVLVYGVLEKKLTLDYAIDALSSGKEIEPTVRMLLRLGLYQIAFLDKIPDHAAVNETVNLAPARAKGFVNAILRSFLRMEKKLPLPKEKIDPVFRLSIEYSVARPLCESFVSAYGIERTKAIFAAFGKAPGLDLRINTLKISVSDYQKLLLEKGIESRALSTGKGVALRQSYPVSVLPSFDAGFCFVQDEASQLALEALGALPGESILDVCACPGSKSFGLALNMENRGEILSCDLHANKLSLVEKGASRLGISIIKTEQKDARDDRSEWHESFDRVLCDVPCSGFGVLAKKPELRYKDPGESAALPAIQSAILARSAEFLKRGGKLLYSTCTLLPRENGEVVQAFLDQNKNFTLVEERTLFPDTDGTDGFYFALLEKK